MALIRLGAFLSIRRGHKLNTSVVFTVRVKGLGLFIQPSRVSMGVT